MKNLDMNPKRTLTAWKANHILCCIKRGMSSMLGEMIPHLYSALMRPHLKYCVQLWDPQQKKNVDPLECVQKITRGLEYLSYEDRLRELEFFSLEERRFWEELIVIFQYLKGGL
ncbi:hypothetical protein WISP_115377 [Willisornis vidua]|uniref:Uncharacterized protein n=1 Tax=Willisornis vidua TaxID=1566151 RepID=A0ABQ9D022_9PASS|nr:hypothetical protein WISP_115377 [Willisornis vidua]